MKLVITPIGIESSTGGQYAPILDDGRFIYIPIPDYSIKNPKHYEILSDLKSFHKNICNYSYDLKTYCEIPINVWPEFPNKKFMGDFLSDRKYKGYPLKSYIPHFDPEFRTFAYGEGSHNKAKTISTLKEGDILVFYMSLIPPFQNKAKGKFIVGYFTIEKVFDFRFSGIKLNYHNVDERIKHNMHIIRRDPDPVIAVGKPSESRLYRHSLQFTDNIKWEILDEIFEKTGWPHMTKKIHMGTKVLEREYARKFHELIVNHDTS